MGLDARGAIGYPKTRHRPLSSTQPGASRTFILKLRLHCITKVAAVEGGTINARRIN
jgi:hypothetical protein